jgi:tRNA 2-thiouridine synthesizing protein E
MATKNIAGVSLEVTDDGYLTDSGQWTKEIAEAIAKEEGVELTDKHFEILDFLRKRQENGDALTIRSINKSGIVDVKTFYQMFPGAPLKKSTKIAGIPKPESCV